jgi:hypothetical protein
VRRLTITFTWLWTTLAESFSFFAYFAGRARRWLCWNFARRSPRARSSRLGRRG